MNPPTFIYARIYNDKNSNYRIYTGITASMKNRQLQHTKNLSRTTKRFNKAFKLKEIKYKEIQSTKYEKTFKNYINSKKIQVSNKWKRWVG